MNTERKRNLIRSVIINTMFLLVFLFVFHPFYETNDDLAMEFSAEGAHGRYSPYIVFSNIIIGRILVFFIKLAPSVPWYVILVYSMLFIAFTLITYIVFQMRGKFWGYLCNVFFLVTFGYATYVQFQFTKTTAVCTTCGVLAIFYGLDYAKKNKEKWICIIIGALLCVYGSMCRFDAFGLCMATLAGLGVLRLIKLIRGSKEERRYALQYVAIFGIVAVCCFGLKLYDGKVYAADEEYAEFVRYNTLRSELWDLGFPDYESNKNKYQALGITKDNFDYYATWNTDPSVMTADALEEIASWKEKPEISLSFIRSVLGAEKGYLSNVFALMTASVAVICIMLNKSNLWLVLYQLVAVEIMQVYLFWIGRFSLSRVDFGFWIAIVMSQIYFLPLTKDVELSRKDKKQWIVLASCAMVVFNMNGVNQGLGGHGVDTKGNRAFFEQIASDKEHLYLSTLGDGAFDITFSYELFQPARKGDMGNIHYIGGWEINLPVTNERLERYDVTNYFADCIDNPNVFFMTNEFSWATQAYIRRNYNENANLCLVRDICNQKIWVVRSKPTELTNIALKPAEGKVESELSLKREDGTLSIDGFAYMKDGNPLQQRCYLKITNSDNKVTYTDLTLKQDSVIQVMNNKAHPVIEQTVELPKKGKAVVEVILEYDGQYYSIIEQKI